MQSMQRQLFTRSLSTFNQGYRFRREFRGPLRGAILDWSGTVGDNWCIAPTHAFVDAFAQFKCKITMEEARGPMGVRKDTHIKMLFDIPDIAKRWKDAHGRFPNDADVKLIYDNFLPVELKCLPQYTDLIPGAAQAVQTLRDKYGLKIGVTTGFPRVILDALLKAAVPQGYKPDSSVAGDEARFPRPYPHVLFKNMELLELMDVKSIVKCDDTVSGIEEGLNAGAWTVGFSHTSNYMNINSYEERKKMSDKEFERRGKASREKLLKAGAHYVVNDITYLPQVVEDINQRLARGETP